jgi:ABC-2 type transport system ATP-binding protein
MDEPFSGMDAIVKDELVRGLLESAGSEGWTVLLSSHDIGELEMLADRVGILADGKMRVTATMDDVRARFRRVEVSSPNGGAIDGLPGEWMAVERAANRLAFTVDTPDEQRLDQDLAARFSGARVEVRPATLREVFVAVAGRRSERQPLEVAA